MGFRCFVRCSAGTASEASSPRSLASSKDDYDLSALHEDRLEYLLSEWRFNRKHFLKGQYLLRAVLRTWLQLCSVDAEIVAAMYNKGLFSAHYSLRSPHQQRLLRPAFVVWRLTSGNYL